MTIEINTVGYKLNELEYKTIIDYNATNYNHKNIECIPHNLDWILPKEFVEAALNDSYWSDYHELIRSRIENKTSETYTSIIGYGGSLPTF